MKVCASRFGDVELSGDEDIVSLPEGLIGFESLRKAFFIDCPEGTLIYWLQSLENKELLTFPILETRIFFPNYEVTFSRRELSILGVAPESTSKLLTYSIITIPENPHEMKANLKAPLCINLQKRIASQIVLQDTKYPIEYPLDKSLRLILSDTKSSDAPTIHSASVDMSKIKAQKPSNLESTS